MSAAPASLFHLVSAAAWAQACEQGVYAPESLAREGFVHLSTAEQVPGTAARFYAGVPDMLVLSLQAWRLPAAVVYEDTMGHGKLFPHLYGPLNPGHVVAVTPLERWLGSIDGA